MHFYFLVHSITDLLGVFWVHFGAFFGPKFKDSTITMTTTMAKAKAKGKASHGHTHIHSLVMFMVIVIGKCFSTRKWD